MPDARRPLIVELTEAIPATDGRERRTELVAVHDVVVGAVHLPRQPLSPEAHADLIWTTCGADLGAQLAATGAAQVQYLSPYGLGRIDRFADPHGAALAEVRNVGPPVTVVIATNAPARTAETIRSIASGWYDLQKLEVVVVANGADVDSFEPVDQVACRVIESRPGASAARNAGAAIASGEILVFFDDDVIATPGSITHAVRRFLEDPNLDCVTGLIVPDRIETEAQVFLEEFGGYGKGFRAAVFDMRIDRLHERDRLFPFRFGAYGSGACAAFRATSFRRFGGFDPRLGPGTPTHAGEDPELFLRLIIAGGRIGYEPSFAVFHEHPADLQALRRRMYAYGVGVGALLTRTVCADPPVLIAILRRFSLGLEHLLSPRSAKNAGRSRSFPRSLVARELLGMCWGPFAFALSTFRSRSHS